MLNVEALEYHRRARKGKIEIRPTKPTATQRDLTLAYTPGVAAPCQEIARERELVYEYTAKSHLVAVVTNGTAVLGLGNIGPEAAKPVMEGKGVLFKKLADVDVFDLELRETDPDRFIQVVQTLEPSFGGINLEDIKAPECFHIEDELRRRMDIPVFHDDQHGTAIITAAALLNALEFAEKRMEDIKVVFSGAGAAGIGCARLYQHLGVRPENLFLTDIDGVVYQGRPQMTPILERFARDTPHRTLADVIAGADVFVGVSAPGVLKPEMVKTMAANPIIFALANPEPEISYPAAKEARPDAIIATGRSDFPNQVNNVLCFPFIFRGALDVQAREINEEMKLAAVRALAALPKQDTPDEVLIAYGLKHLRYGRDYLIPTPFDPRVLLYVAPAVAQAAIETGVARKAELDVDAYRDALAASQSFVQETTRRIMRRARAVDSRRRVVFPEARNETILRACAQIVAEGIAQPVLVGDETAVAERARELRVSLEGVEIVDNRTSPLRTDFAEEYFRMRQRKGMLYPWALLTMDRPVEFALMMLQTGQADSFVGGITRSYPEIIRPALQIIGLRKDIQSVSGFYMILYRDKTLFLADTTVNLNPTHEVLAEIAINTAKAARFFGHTPKVALLSYTNFGSVRNPDTVRITDALRIVHKREPGLMIDGEMQAHFAINEALRAKHYPFAELEGQANVLIFPNLHASNNAYRLLSELSEAEIIGPILTGMTKPVNVLSQEALVQDVVNMTALSVLEAREGVL